MGLFTHHYFNSRYVKKDEVPTKIGYMNQQPPGIYVVCQRMPGDNGTWELDQIVVSRQGQMERMRGNNNINYDYPVFFRPNFISDVVRMFGV